MTLGDIWEALPVGVIISFTMGLLLRLVAYTFDWLERYLSRS